MDHADSSDRNVADVVAELRRMVKGGRGDEAIDIVEDLLSAVMRENDAQAAKIRELLRKAYGRSSERIDPNQLRLALEGLREDSAPAPSTDPETDAPNDPPAPARNKAEKKRGGGRRPLPDHLEREEVRLLPTDAQIAGKGRMTKVGEERSEILEYIPGRFKVMVYVRETWSSASGEIVTAPLPNKVIEKGIPGPGLLTHVVLSKYKDHCPLNRQVGIFRRSGVELSKNTLVDWIAAAAFLLEPLANRIDELAMLAHVLQVDDTRLPVLDRRKAKNIKRAHLWDLVGDREWISFHYTESWSAEEAKKFLGRRIGWTQIDGYGGYESMIEDGYMMPVGCWMHARRYFVKAFDGKDLRAAVPLDKIKRLYEIEREAKDASNSHDERYQRRQRDMVPILDELEEWIEAQLKTEPPKSTLGRALTYAHNHWDMLRVVVNDGALEFDNGDVERVIRGPAVGRRNY